jgi:hypothetical protein
MTRPHNNGKKKLLKKALLRSPEIPSRRVRAHSRRSGLIRSMMARDRGRRDMARQAAGHATSSVQAHLEYLNSIFFKKRKNYFASPISCADLNFGLLVSKRNWLVDQARRFPRVLPCARRPHAAWQCCRMERIQTAPGRRSYRTGRQISQPARDGIQFLKTKGIFILGS